MSVDFPRAWQICKEISWEEHQEKCSFHLTGCLLCDCNILTQHPEYLSDDFFGKDGIIFKKGKEK